MNNNEYLKGLNKEELLLELEEEEHFRDCIKRNDPKYVSKETVIELVKINNRITAILRSLKKLY